MDKAEGIRVRGKVTLVLKDPGGKVKQTVVSNLVLTDGLEIIADIIGNTGGPQPYLKCIALGDNNTAPVVGDTDLKGAELGRVTTSNSRVGSDTERFQGSFGAGVGTGNIKEAVLADTNAAAGGRKCACRATFGTIVKGAGDTLVVFWDLKFA